MYSYDTMKDLQLYTPREGFISTDVILRLTAPCITLYGLLNKRLTALRSYISRHVGDVG